MIQNVVIGTPLVPPAALLAADEEDWERNEKEQTLFCEERYLPRILKDIGAVTSTSELRRNRPDLVRTLNTPDFLSIKLGKKRVFVVVGN